MTDILAAFPGISYASITAEVRREIDHRRTAYPHMVAKGRMTEAEARWQQQVFAAIQRDVASMSQGQHQPDPAFSWADKVRALTREVDLRLKFYPGWIQKGRLALKDARQQSAALECLLTLYEDGWGWTARNGTNPAWGTVHPTPAQAASRTEWRDLHARIMARRTQSNDNAQERMAL